ncbi:phosphatase PAP2 family protein [Myceligenerans indicum]|uniref:Phosphatase PAP2 family protein n=1 Tax=Myceligenerans indicum TaxID=2593663 RepID=A0ABS1LLF9_9MICO|nr:phosphatase PAP2 family protein [Myceligenerans indicum]MBL0886969.1 phosphatase PAP2 family protein [Myceligenerans indicum]
MLRFQGAQGAPYGAVAGRGLPDAGALPATDPAQRAAAAEPAGARRVADVVGRVRTDLRSARSGAVAQPWIAPATIGVVLALTFVWMVLQVVSAGPLVAADAAAREWVYAHQARGGMATFLEVQAFVTGERWATVPVVMGVAALVAHRRGRMRPLYAVMAGLVTIGAIGYPVKFGLGRSSPVTGIDMLHAGGQAFPSGHAANTAFTATMVVFLLYGSAGLRPDPHRLRRGMAAVAALLAVSGPLVAWMGYHWLSDIPAGWLMGFLAVCVSLTALHWPDLAATRTDPASEHPASAPPELT